MTPFLRAVRRNPRTLSLHFQPSRHLLRAFAWIVFTTAGSCRGESIYRDLAEPLTMEDYVPLPSDVGPGNAALAVRHCLQAHRRSISTPDEQTGYAFRPDGFVQLFHAHPADRENERGVRTYVEYRSITSVQVDPFFDPQYLKDRFRLILNGDFRRWESHIRAFLPQPDLGAELETQGVQSLTLVLDDAAMAQLLYRALLLLSHPKRP